MYRYYTGLNIGPVNLWPRSTTSHRIPKTWYCGELKPSCLGQYGQIFELHVVARFSVHNKVFGSTTRFCYGILGSASKNVLLRQGF